MRVVAGQFRGRPLIAPAGAVTRPILDRVKVSVFDWLGSRLAEPGSLPAVHVLDLFCGAGSLGIEALSRGAAYCVFVEQDAEALDCLRKNIDELGIHSKARVIGRPVETAYIPAPSEGARFGLVFLDPPYRLSEDLSPTSVLSRVLGRFGTDIPTEPNALLLWRHDAHFTPPERCGIGWRRVEARSWGGMTVTLFVFLAEGLS